LQLTREQLEAVVSRDLPGARLRDAREVTLDRYALALADGERLSLQLFAVQREAAATAAALHLLRAEVDLPIPQIRAADEAGATIGMPYVVTSEVAGEPLARVQPRLSEAHLYDIGVRLGQTIYRVHRLLCEQYGELAGDPDSTRDEREYALARLRREVEACGDAGLLDRHTADRLLAWFEAEFQPPGRQPALLHGDLSPETVLVRASDEGWRVSALLGWEFALGWAPAYDHVALLDAVYQPPYFGLRVGYGNGYDELATRAYEQVRDLAMMPYRALMALRRMRESRLYGDIPSCNRYRTVLLTSLALLEGGEART
jgi:aminoglycoside phosphotransferase (APT) family kinase protein